MHFRRQYSLHSENLQVVISGIDGLNWHSVSEDGIGKIYEGLLSKNSEDARSGAGQYFTPRALVDCIIAVTQPTIAETIQDPATGTGGFLIGAEQYIRNHSSSRDYSKTPPKYQGMEIERGTYRLCLMNIFLHRMKADLILGDALTADGSVLAPADLILANPPFGSKSGSARDKRSDLSFPSSNKQLEFLQHIYRGLKSDGRAAVVVPDNVLFEGGIARQIRNELMDRCNLHTILRLPTGIFYAQNVSTNVLFFTRSARQSGSTKRVWIYDLRSSMPRFGKRNPLTLDHFSDFIKCFGSLKDGASRRRASGIGGRFRSFERAEIAANNDDLNLKWLADKSDSDSQELSDPETIAGQIIENLRQATKETQNLIDILASLSDQGPESSL
jgi:type I restriction enzyme M protein